MPAEISNPHQWQVSYNDDFLPPQFAELLRFDEQKASWAANALATPNTPAAHVSVEYVSPAHQAFTIKTPEADQLAVAVSIPSYSMEDLERDYSEVNRLTIEGLQRAIDLRRYGKQLDFDEYSLSRQLSPGSRRDIRKLTAICAGITLFMSGITLGFTAYEFGPPADIIAPIGVTLAYSGPSFQKVRARRQNLRRQNAGWRREMARTKELQYYQSAVDTVSNLGPIVTLNS